MATSSVPQESIEAQAYHVLEQLKEGKMTISDLLGPLYGTRELNPLIPVRRGDKSIPCTAPEAHVEPQDEHNIKLVSNVHPPDYVNPEPLEKYDIVVIGAGVAGLLSVIIAKGLGKTTCLIEKNYMGGDCLNVGCFPSKAIIRSARAVQEVRNCAEFGVILPEGEIRVDFPFIMERMRRLRASISPHDSVARYSRDFCDHVFLGEAKFISTDAVEVGGKVLRFEKAMIATGASAAVPPVPGLQSIPHLTNSNIFNLTELPPRFAVIGCGPIGLEMSQTMGRFGARIELFEVFPQLLPREDIDAAELLKEQLEKDGLIFHFGIKFKNIELLQEGDLYKSTFPLYRVTYEQNGQEFSYECEAVLNATGRAPNVHGIGLDVAGVEYDNISGVHIDEYFQTSNPNIYSCGDVASVFKFTHAADWQARIAIRNMFLGDRNRLSQLLIPWCTYTDPEIAHVGFYEKELESRNIEYETFIRQLPAVDRCICDGVKAGFVKITIKKGTDEIIGATIVGPRAGDMISEITVCMQNNIGVARLAGVIHPYPTTAESIRQCAAQYNKNFKTPVQQKVLSLLMDKEKHQKEGEEKQNH